MSVVLRPFKWFYHEFGIVSIHNTGRNAYLIILARTCRMFAYGTNSLILAIFFSALEFSDHKIGLFMTLTLLGDVFLGTFLTLVADRVGRRKVLMGGSFLMVFSGVIFAVSENFWILLLAAILGVISVTGGDFGPFRSIEESMLSQLTTPSSRADVLAWYVTTSTLGSSIGSEASGRILRYLQARDGWTAVDAYHALFWVYTAMGLVNAILVLPLTKDCELESTEETYVEVAQDETENDAPAEQPNVNHDLEAAAQSSRNWAVRAFSWFAHRFAQISAPTRAIMYKLWFLLAVDSLADGMVPYSLTNYYIDIKFHPSKSALGDVTSMSYFLGAIGAVFAGPLARKIGLINTMVFSHVPSSAAVLFFPFPPVFWLTAGLLLVRAGLNQMDQAPRSAFIAAVVKSEERTAVMGITAMVRTLAAMTGPTLTGFLAAEKHFWIAFVLAGICRLAYDFGLYAMFVNMKLYQHESKDNLPNGHGHPVAQHDEEEEVELESLAESEDTLDETK
ncbi:hypothetical protein PV11_04041 [Exophiala sideris]|uniref:Major facilitator superfamily (MFS) profile domain-containing protein n=1 Tax=Exophiala sideris TaxID=1016849 RepID=A0A0D1X2S2_9EURO|nr:hypothetical protein PV11_04041 [Exophiala sideris]